MGLLIVGRYDVANKVRIPQSNSAGKASRYLEQTCGIVMPISTSANHSREYYGMVRFLIEEIVGELMTPLCVWEGADADAIAQRVFRNIEKLPLVIFDITDTVPNVMIELGLRLGTRKPMIIVKSTSQHIPFDITTFEVISYPDDLNIIGMREFHTALIKAMRCKLDAYFGGTYQCYLGDTPCESGAGIAMSAPRSSDSYAEIVDKVDRLERNAVRVWGSLPNSTTAIPEELVALASAVSKVKSAG